MVRPLSWRIFIYSLIINNDHIQYTVFVYVPVAISCRKVCTWLCKSLVLFSLGLHFIYREKINHEKGCTLRQVYNEIGSWTMTCQCVWSCYPYFPSQVLLLFCRLVFTRWLIAVSFTTLCLQLSSQMMRNPLMLCHILMLISFVSMTVIRGMNYVWSHVKAQFDNKLRTIVNDKQSEEHPVPIFTDHLATNDRKNNSFLDTTTVI